MERAWTSEELPLSGVDWSRTGAGGVTKDALGATLAGGGGPAMPKYTTRQYSQNTGLYAKGTISKAMRLSLPSTSRYHGKPLTARTSRPAKHRWRWWWRRHHPGRSPVADARRLVSRHGPGHRRYAERVQRRTVEEWRWRLLHAPSERVREVS